MIGNKKCVMIAVLNQGEIREELSNVLLEFATQNKYELMITYPAAKPITQNRNKIVQDFLSKPQYDYLIMIDSDNVPPIDLLNLVDFQKDIIGSIYFGYQKNMIVPWVLERKPDGLYTVVELRGKRGLIEVDAVGTGVIVIKREVLEKLRFPFRNEYDADGIKLLGLDINFCQRAKKLGFKVYCHLDYISSHWVVMDLKDIYALVLESDNLKKQVEKLEERINKVKVHSEKR